MQPLPNSDMFKMLCSKMTSVSPLILLMDQTPGFSPHRFTTIAVVDMTVLYAAVPKRRPESLSAAEMVKTQ